METHGTASLSQFAELASIVTRALPKAIEGVDIKKVLVQASMKGEWLSSLLRTALISLAPRFTVYNRVYELVPFHKEGEISVMGDVMVKRAQELDANLGEEDCRFIVAHQEQISFELRDKFHAVFANLRISSDGRICYLYSNGCRWVQTWGWPVNGWDEHCLLVRRVK